MPKKNVAKWTVMRPAAAASTGTSGRPDEPGAIGQRVHRLHTERGLTDRPLSLAEVQILG